MKSTLGNILGDARAEADQVMLSRAFIETVDYQTILHTTDFNYVVGRRGTGKSAIYQRLCKDFTDDTGVILLTEEPQDYEMLEFQTCMEQVSKEYRILRPIARLLWSAHVLIQATKNISKHYKYAKSKHSLFLNQYLKKHSSDAILSGCEFCTSLLRQVLKEHIEPDKIPRFIVDRNEISVAMDALKEVLDDTGIRIVYLCDKLDESWLPEAKSIAIMGGLTKAVADYRERKFPVYPVLFIRDNMFRALAQLDDDFTRHIEAHSLRLQWDENSLFHLIAARLRVALDLHEVEQDVKVWNRFASRNIQNRGGFIKCLRYTLYRPRDILVLINSAYVIASRDLRTAIIDEDVIDAATAISQHRLEDLCKEYDKVLPGLRLFVSAFKGHKASRPLLQVINSLEERAEQDDYSKSASQDLMIFKGGSEMFSVLYSVGFIGLKDPLSGNYTFCHDGTMRALASVESSRDTIVHPCYWKALDIAIEDEQQDVVIQINDEYEAKPNQEVIALRLQRLGRLPEELVGIQKGLKGCRDFETWALRAIRVLFSGTMSNIEFKPNPANALNQRDIVGTNLTTTNFWRRVHEDYHSRQIIFECKNYDEITPEDFRQVLDYTSGDYGNFVIILRRGKGEALTDNEKDRIRSMFHEHKRLVMILPESLLVLCIKKLRTPKQYNYTEFTMGKHLDMISRSVLSLTHLPQYKLKRNK